MSEYLIISSSSTIPLPILPPYPIPCHLTLSPTLTSSQTIPNIVSNIVSQQTTRNE
jgi:hypothetical protein